jgi:hypothetical protein
VQITEEVKGMLTTAGSGAQDVYKNMASTAGSMWGVMGSGNPSVPNFNFS